MVNFFRKTHVELIRQAIAADPKIVSTREKPEPHEEWYLDSLGLTESLLKRMERVGLAARGYRREVGPHNGKHGKGYKRYWIIFAPGESNGIEEQTQRATQRVSIEGPDSAGGVHGGQSSE